MIEYLVLGDASLHACVRIITPVTRVLAIIAEVLGRASLLFLLPALVVMLPSIFAFAMMRSTNVVDLTPDVAHVVFDLLLVHALAMMFLILAGVNARMLHHAPNIIGGGVRAEISDGELTEEIVLRDALLALFMRLPDLVPHASSLLLLVVVLLDKLQIGLRRVTVGVRLSAVASLKQPLVACVGVVSPTLLDAVVGGAAFAIKEPFGPVVGTLTD